MWLKSSRRLLRCTTWSNIELWAYSTNSSLLVTLLVTVTCLSFILRHLVVGVVPSNHPSIAVIGRLDIHACAWGW